MEETKTFNKNENKMKQKVVYYKLTPKLKKLEQEKWIKNYLAFDSSRKTDKVKLKDISPICIICSKPVHWAIRINDFKSDLFPEMDLKYIYCCSEECTIKVCSIINMVDVEFKQSTNEWIENVKVIRQQCSKCNCKEGQNHAVGCPKELCTRCGDFLVKCKHKTKEREPYFDIARPYIHCKRCGDFIDKFKDLTDKQWIDIYGITYGKDDCNDLLCLDCLKFVKKLRSKNEK